MRILLAQNSLYYPAHGGGDKSNRLLLEALAARGHACRAVARIGAFGESGQRRYLAELAARGVAAAASAGGVVRFERAGVAVHVVTQRPTCAPYFAEQIEEFHPDVILASTDDPAQLLLEAALRGGERPRGLPGARHAGRCRSDRIAPFPARRKPNGSAPPMPVVCVSQYVADYVRR